MPTTSTAVEDVTNAARQAGFTVTRHQSYPNKLRLDITRDQNQYEFMAYFYRSRKNSGKYVWSFGQQILDGHDIRFRTIRSFIHNIEEAARTETADAASE